MKQRPALGCALEIIETLALTLIIFFVIQNFVAQPYKVQQQSMERTLEPEQYVLVDKLTPRFDTYKRGDIVVFTPPADWVQDNGTPFIKRVIGVGGDTVELVDGAVLVNGTKIDEPYLYKDEVTGLPQPTTSDDDIVAMDRARRRALPDGRPSPELGRLTCVRARAGDQRHRSRLAALLAARHVRDPPHAHLPGAGTGHPMNPALAGVALAVIVGAIVAASARDARTAVLGLGVTLIAAPAIADPISATTGIAARVVAAILAIYLLWIAVRDGEADTGGSSIGLDRRGGPGRRGCGRRLRPARPRGGRSRAARAPRRPDSPSRLSRSARS